MPILAILANRFVIAGLAFALLGAWGAWNRHQLNAVTAEYESFKVETKAAGIAAQQAADASIAADKERKEKSDAMLKTRITALAADNKRLRDSAGASSLPARPADTRCPETWACFDRGELDSAIRRFTQDTSGLVAEGAAVRLQLTTAMEWATSIKP
jgi:hypothetical protein